jgi:MFS family permease
VTPCFAGTGPAGAPATAPESPTKGSAVPRLSRLLADIRPLRECPPFRRLWAGLLLSAIGSSMTSFAITLQVYRLTHSTLAVGAVGLTGMFPTLTAGMFGGSLVDRLDRRRLVLVTSGGLTAVSALFAVQAGGRQVWPLYLLVAVQAALGAIDNPARRAIVPRLLPARLLPAGVALNQLSFQLTLVTGPTLAGLIAAAGGLRLCYVIDALSFAAALYGVVRLPAVPPAGRIAARSLRAVAEGIRFIWTSRPLAGAFLADLSATVLGLPVALFPAINAERFGGSPQTLGLLTTAIGVGGVLGSAFSGPVGRIVRPGRAMLITVSVWGAGLAGFGAAGALWLALACLAIAGAADTTTVVFRSTIVQTVVPDRLRGRITAAEYVVGVGGPQLGSLEAGAVGSLASPAISAISGGLACIAGAILIGAALPAFTRYRRSGAPDTDPDADPERGAADEAPAPAGA